MAFSGFTAGLLGIGGALIFNPVLLQLGVHPQVFFSCSAVEKPRTVLFNSILLKLGVHPQVLSCLLSLRKVL
jgi:uncharacterized membrane protein YfcA